jgi:lambda repressor-like predicted transcriptional regulator
MSLLQDVLRSQVPDSKALEKRLNNVVQGGTSSDDSSDDELVNVVSHNYSPMDNLIAFLIGVSGM